MVSKINDNLITTLLPVYDSVHQASEKLQLNQFYSLKKFLVTYTNFTFANFTFQSKLKVHSVRLDHTSFRVQKLN